MNKKQALAVIPDEVLLSKIYLIRNQNIMLDSDLAELYGVETKVLKQAVRRNIERFPDDFMFELSNDEYDALKLYTETPKRGKYSKYLPFAFSEHGVLMLSSVLKSERAIKVNIQIMRIYTKMKEMLLTNKDILLKHEQLEKLVIQNSEEIELIFKALKQLLNKPQKPKELIGFKTGQNKP